MNLRVLLGDQLSHSVSSLADIDTSNDVVLLCEVRNEAKRVSHHKKKIAFIFSAMRHFDAELQAAGVNTRYIQYDDPENAGSITGEVERAIAALHPDQVVITEPSEYAVLKEVQNWKERLSIPVAIHRDDRFLCTKATFYNWAKGRKQLRMEFFYREMRRKHGVLMDGDQPEGGKWNYDAENRKPPKSGLEIPETYLSEPDSITQQVLDLVGREFDDHFGDLGRFHFAVTSSQAQQALDQFIRERLANFGDYQDAMLQGEPWMYHSHLSFYINCGLLTPLECIQKAEHAYRKGLVPLNAAEGFIRQLLGWREYVRGLYWLKMPAYVAENYLHAKRPLPQFYWSAATKMNCLRQCVLETKQNAYAHHIQRLMILGNFALLAGLNPEEVNNWFWIVYADAYQWVELPNVSGMILFADGGVVASKPYAASGAYINRMSNYCKSCSYKVSQKNGPSACPFNYLYWDFLLRQQNTLQNNPRMAMPYRTLAKMNTEKKDAVCADTRRFLNALECGEMV
jgi:deoxyribodipyrimidine photolyase-related protein